MRIYLEEITAAANRTGDTLKLKIDAQQIGDAFGMDHAYVLSDLQRMRRILCTEAVRS